MRCTDKKTDIPWAVSDIWVVVTSVLQLQFDFDPVVTALQINTIWLDVHLKLMSRAGLFGNSYSFIIFHADVHSLVPFPCLSEQPWPLPVLAVRALLLPAGALTELMVLFSVRQGNRHQSLIFSLLVVNKDPKGSKTFSLWTKHLPPISVLVSPAGSLQCHPICSSPFSWRAWSFYRCVLIFAVPEEFPAPTSAASCILQFSFSFFFSQNGGFATKQSHSWGLHIDFIKEQGNMPRHLHTNMLLWWGGRWSSSRTVWGNRLLHPFVSPSPLFVMPFYWHMSENDALGKLEKHIPKCTV